jgi:MoaA/NifB/PqqE/SkfB family radical SAM enzyme
MTSSTRASLVLQRRRDHGVVFDRRSGTHRRVDLDELALLVALRGDDDAPQRVAADVVDAWPDPERARAIVVRLASDGVFFSRGRLLADVAPDHDDVVDPPLLLHLEIHGACPLRCTHCFAGALPRRETPLSRDELRALFAELWSLGTTRVSLTGGEPLLRRDFFDVVDDAAAAGLFVSLTTSGVTIDDDVARALAARLHDGRLGWLSVSLEGPDAALNDAVRGAGVFDDVVGRLAHLRAHDAPFALAFTVRPALTRHVVACARFARDVGAGGAVFRPLYPTGHALRDPSLWPTRAQWTQALDSLRRWDDPDVAIVVERSDASGDDDHDDHDEEERAPHACDAGRTQASVSLGGHVSPCSFLGEDFMGPSLRGRGFFSLWREHAVFRAVRDDDDDRDGGYDGGCRARSLAVSGSVHARDPWRDPHVTDARRRRTGRALPVLSTRTTEHG